MNYYILYQIFWKHPFERIIVERYVVPNFASTDVRVVSDV